MAEFTLKLRRYDPDSGEPPYWERFTVDLEPHRSVLDGILEARARLDGSIGIRCSCRAAICGSCGVRINGQPGLACHTHLELAQRGARGGEIEVEPMGNMPVLKDLIVDMDRVHWAKIRRVTPWLINKEPIPEREYLVDHESMVDVTQSMACIQCGACVSDCLSMEVDPLFIGPAALAKAYRFVGDPRDAQRFERLKDLSEDRHGIYDCTHCFKCIEACPKGVAPMNQIMRLRRAASRDHEIVDRNNGERHMRAFTSLVRRYGVLWESEVLARSLGGDSALAKLHPNAGRELAAQLPVIARALLRGKVTPGKALRPPQEVPKDARRQIQRLYDKVEGREEQVVLNLYVTGYDDEPTGGETTEHGGAIGAGARGDGGQAGAEAGTPGLSPRRSPSR